jgi:4-hydroxybenzoate polyprenyltransferase
VSAAPSTIRAYLELARVSNALTVVTNVLTGCAIATASLRTIVGDDAVRPAEAGLTGGVIALVALAMVLMYIAGMALNDVFDVEDDRRERPGRPIPSGRVTVRAACGFAIVCMAGGLTILALQSRPALVLGLLLAACIIAYNWLHKRSAASVALMGACRGLLYLVAAAAVAWPLDWTIAGTLAAALFAYVIALSLVARHETRSEHHAGPWATLVLPIIALAPVLLIHPTSWLVAAVCGVLLVLWLAATSMHLRANPPRIGAAVTGWLAGICLIDALYVALLDQPRPALICVGCFIVTRAMQRVIAAT